MAIIARASLKGSPWPCASAASAGSEGLATTTTCRRREHRHGLDQRARGGLLEQVGEDDDQRALGAFGAAEGELVVAVERPGLEVEERAGDGLPALAARLERDADRSSNAIAPVRSPSSSATKPSATAASSDASSTFMPVGPSGAALEAARVEQEQQVAILLEPVLVAHRPPEPRRRAPVDLADVVVGLVVADQLELRAEAERAARGGALVAEAPAGDGERQALARRAGRGRRAPRLGSPGGGPSARA